MMHRFIRLQRPANGYRRGLYHSHAFHVLRFHEKRMRIEMAWAMAATNDYEDTASTLTFHYDGNAPLSLKCNADDALYL